MANLAAANFTTPNIATIARSFLVIAGGFVTMAAIVGAATAILVRVAPGFVGEQAQPRPGYISFNLIYSALAAAAGGYVTARLAPANAILHVLMLALAVLLLSALSALQLKGKQPILYQIALTAITPLAVFGGGILRLKQAGAF